MPRKKPGRAEAQELMRKEKTSPGWVVGNLHGPGSKGGGPGNREGAGSESRLCVDKFRPSGVGKIAV